MNILSLMQQAASIQKGIKQIQRELSRKTVEGRSGGGEVTVKARCDMFVESVRIDPAAAGSGNLKHLEQSVTEAVNLALKSAKDTAADEMSKVAAEHGLPPGLPGLKDLL